MRFAGDLFRDATILDDLLTMCFDCDGVRMVFQLHTTAVGKRREDIQRRFGIATKLLVAKNEVDPMMQVARDDFTLQSRTMKLDEALDIQQA